MYVATGEQMKSGVGERPSPTHVVESGSALARHLGIKSMVHYWFNPSIDTRTAISSFWFEVSEVPLGIVKLYDNDGKGFPIEQDRIAYAPALGRHKSNISEGTQEDPAGWKIAVAIRNDGSPATNVRAHNFVYHDEFAHILRGRLPESFTLTLDATHPPANGYSIYSFFVPLKRFGLPDRFWFDVSADFGGETVTEEYVNSFYTSPGTGAIPFPPGTYPPEDE